MNSVRYLIKNALPTYICISTVHENVYEVLLFTFNRFMLNEIFQLNASKFTSFLLGAMHKPCGQPWGEGGSWNVHFTNKAYVVKLSTKGGGGGGKKVQKTAHMVCACPLNEHYIVFYLFCTALFLPLIYTWAFIRELKKIRYKRWKKLWAFVFQKYNTFWRGFLEHFMKHKALISEEWCGSEHAIPLISTSDGKIFQLPNDGAFE